MPRYRENEDMLSYIKKLERRLEVLERTAQLASSSIEDGALMVNTNDGTTSTMQIGKQFDDTFAPTVLTGPTPPTPSGITVTAGDRGVIVEWNGTYLAGALTPMDFARVSVHIGPPAFDPLLTVPVHSFTSPQGGKVFVPMPIATYEVSLITRTQAGIPSVPSAGQAATAQSGSTKVTFSASVPGSTPNTAGEIWERYAGSEIIGRWIGAGGTSWTPIEFGGTTLSATAIDGKVITGSTLRTDDTGQERVEIVGGTGTSDNEVRFFVDSSATDPIVVRSGDLWGNAGTKVLKIENPPKLYSGLPTATQYQKFYMAMGDDFDVSQACSGMTMYILTDESAAGFTDGSATPTAWIKMFNDEIWLLADEEITLSGRVKAADMRYEEDEYTDSTAVNVTSTTGTPVGSRGGDEAFVAPASGAVTVWFTALLKAPADGTYMSHGVELRTGATIGSGTVVEAFAYQNGAEAYNAQYQTTTKWRRFTGLTPGADYHVRQIALVQSGTGSFARGSVLIVKEL